MARAYAGIIGAVLLLVGIVGYTTASLMGMTFTPVHNIIHVVSGILGLLAAMMAGGAKSRLFAQVFGIIYVLVAIIGFMGMANPFGIQLALNMPYNLVHVVVGVLGIIAGFTGSKS